jgi:exodeoxyribonuclease VII small subunit
MMTEDLSELSFEAAYAELEAIISQLDAGDLPLEDSVRLFERGRKLSEHCQTLLDRAELRVSQLLEGGRIESLDR